MRNDPPKYALKFLRWFCREDYMDEVEGDLAELYQKQCEVSPNRAKLKFIGSVFRHLRPEYLKLFHQTHSSHSLMTFSMIRNYLLLAFRNLFKRTAFSFINIFGLALGVSACLVILNYMDFETSYDSFNENAGSIYRINRSFIQNEERKQPMVKTTYGLGPALENDLPEVKRFVRTHEESIVITYHADAGETKGFHESKVMVVDSTFFDVFTFKSVRGELLTALDDPNSIVLTQSVSQKYFGSTDPIGKTLVLAGGRMDGSYTVSTIIEEVPQNSHFTFDILLPIHNIFLTGQYSEDDGWGWNNFITYVQLNENADYQTAENKLPDFCQRRLDPKWKEYNGRLELHLQPLRDIHLHPGLRLDVDTVNPNTIYFFGLIGAFILFIAWINYINLSTARAMERAREVGIKKAIGAVRGELITQFLFESLVINFIAIIIAVMMAVVLLPVLGGMIGKELSFHFTDWRLWFTIFILFGAGTLASGIYPALVLSSYRITSALKTTGGELSLRKVLVVFQLTASLVLMAGTFVVYRQINFMQTQDKGLQMDQMLVIKAPGTLKWNEAKKRLSLFKEEAKKIQGVEAITTSGAIPGGGHNWGADVRKVNSPVTATKTASLVWVDNDFIPSYHISFLSGRNFNPQIQSDMKSSVIVNEASLAVFELGDASQAINQQLLVGDDTITIIGVVKNYNWTSLKSEYVPFLLAPDTIVPAVVSIHLAGESIPSAIDALSKLYKDLIPGDPFEYYFLDDFFNTQYKADRQFGHIFGLFAGLAVAISCLGLWGLASFNTAQKLKEVGIRKVLGASTGSIVYLLVKQFLLLVGVAALIALPVIAYSMNSWLDSFAFRISLKPDMFIVPVLSLMVIALCTVSIQVLKGAATNPAKVLKSE